jgi:hypothetical protein
MHFQSKYLVKLGDEMARLLMNVSDAITGGAFESRERNVCPARYLLIVNAITEVGSRLLKTKI